MKPEIPDGYLFVAVTTSDPAAPVAILGWPTIRRNTPEGDDYSWPVNNNTVRLRCKQDGLDMVRWAIVQYDDLPDDRDGTQETYRDGLKHDGTKIVHDLVKCKAIKREHLRIARLEKMLDLDGKWMRATGQGNKAEQDAVEAERQKWRDAPADPRIETARSVEELKQIRVA